MPVHALVRHSLSTLSLPAPFPPPHPQPAVPLVQALAPFFLFLVVGLLYGRSSLGRCICALAWQPTRSLFFYTVLRLWALACAIP